MPPIVLSPAISSGFAYTPKDQVGGGVHDGLSDYVVGTRYFEGTLTQTMLLNCSQISVSV